MVNICNDSVPDPGAVNEAVNLFISALRAASDPIFLKNKKSLIVEGGTREKPKWADDSWYPNKKAFYKSRDQYKKQPSIENRVRMVNARSHYKKTCIANRRAYEQSQSMKLKKAKLDNVKLYWQMLSGKKPKPKTRVPSEVFYAHFKDLSNPTGNSYLADPDTIEEYNNLINDEFTVIYEELDSNFKVDDIKKAIDSLKNGKQPGDDLILNEFFIYGKDLLSVYLTTLLTIFLKVAFFQLVGLMG
jgi:hypothetical protein